MAVTQYAYGLGMVAIMTKKVDLSGDTIKVLLVDGTYSFAQDTHQYKTDVTGEVTGTGYTAGGIALTTKTVTYDGANNRAKFDCDDPSWPSSTINANGAVFYHDTGTAGTSELLAYWDFGGTVSSSAGAFTLTIPTNGVLSMVTA